MAVSPGDRNVVADATAPRAAPLEGLFTFASQSFEPRHVRLWFGVRQREWTLVADDGALGQHSSDSVVETGRTSRVTFSLAHKSCRSSIVAARAIFHLCLLNSHVPDSWYLLHETDSKCGSSFDLRVSLVASQAGMGLLQFACPSKLSSARRKARQREAGRENRSIC
jgi:hypothetical protein